MTAAVLLISRLSIGSTGPINLPLRGLLERRVPTGECSTVRIVLAIVAFCLAHPLQAVFSQDKASTVTIPETGITFLTPRDFKPLSKELIAAKWPSNRAPAYAVGNDRGATTIAYDIKANELPQNQLPDAQKSFTSLFERIIPGIEWKKNEIKEHSGQKWLLMEMTSHAVDTDIYNIMFVTGYKGKMLIFNFNSTREEFPKYKKALRASMQSIRLPK